MSVSQAVSCVPEPIITEKLRDKENDKDNEKKNQKGNGKEMEMENGKGKEEFQPNDGSLLSPVSINSKFSFETSSFNTFNKDIDILPRNSNQLAEFNTKDNDESISINSNNTNSNINNSTNNNNNNKSLSKTNLLRTTLFKNQQYLEQSSSSSYSTTNPNDKLIVSIPKKPYSSADTNEVNSATTFCTTKTDFSSPNSSNPSATKDTSSKLKQYDVIPTPIYQVSLDLPLKQNTSHLDQSPKQKSSLTDKFIPINEDDNQHNYKSSVTSFFNSLDDSVDFQSYTNSVKGLEMSESHQQQQQFTKSNLPPQGLDNVIIATTNSYSSFSSALTSPLARPIPSTTEPEEYVIPQPPEITLNNFDLGNVFINLYK